MQDRQFVVIPARILQDQRLTGSEKILLAMISSLAESGGFCFASNEYLAEHSGSSERTIQRQIRNLEKNGYVERVRDDDLKTGRRIYINYDDRNDVGGASELSPQGRQARRGGDDKMSPNSTDDNKEENTVDKKVRGYSGKGPYHQDVVLPWQTLEFEEAWGRWITYKIEEKRFRFRSAKTEQAALLQLQKESRDQEFVAIQAISKSIASAWQGIHVHREMFKLTPVQNQQDGLAEALREQGYSV
jgi:hypothetical protein